MNLIHYYLLKSFLKVLFFYFLGFSILISTINFFEVFRVFSPYNLGILQIIYINILKVQVVIVEASPFIFLFATLHCFMALSRTQEATILKALGYTTWKIVKPALIISILLSLFVILVWKPLASFTQLHYEKIKFTTTNSGSSNVLYSSEAIWIVDKLNYKDKNIIIAKGASTSSSEITLLTPSFIEIRSDKVISRVSSEKGILKDNVLTLINNQVKYNEKSFPEFIENLKIPVSLEGREFQALSKMPDETYIWELPSIIISLSKLNLNHTPYIIELLTNIVKPIMFVTMLLLAYYFGITPNRKSKPLVKVLYALSTGFSIYFVGNLFSAFALSGSLSHFISLILIYIIFLMVFITALLYKEGY